MKYKVGWLSDLHIPLYQNGLMKYEKKKTYQKSMGGMVSISYTRYLKHMVPLYLKQKKFATAMPDSPLTAESHP